MAVPVPAGVVFSYGLGKSVWTFGPYIKTKVTETPVAGSGDRTVKYSEITITVNGWITQAEADAWAASQGMPAGAPLDAVMFRLRRILQRHGSNLKYVNEGYGQDLNVNDPSGVSTISDVAMGPRAGEFHWHSLGGAPDGCHGAVFDWSVSCTIFECTRAGTISLRTGGPSVFSDVTFTVAYDTEESGLVTITTTGKAEIPLSLNPANGGLDTQIDDYFVNVVRPVQAGYLRKMHRQLSADRRSCDFTITDRQIEIAYPDDVIEIDAKHKVKASNMANRRWNTTITATIRLRPGAPKSTAWFRFYALVRQRVVVSINGTGGVGSGTGNPVGGITSPQYEMEEDIFKNSARFSATYFVTTSLDKILAVSGMWQQVDTTFRRWLGTLSGNSQAPLGILGVRFDKSQDIIIDACGNNATNGGAGGSIQVGGVTETAGSSDAAGGPWDDDDEYDDGAISAFEPIGVTSPSGEDDGASGEIVSNSDGTGLRFVGPDGGAQIQGWGSKMPINPLSSWLEWTCSVRRIIDYKQIRHKPLSGTATTDVPQIDVTAKDSLAQVAADTSPDSIGFQSTVPDIVQQIASPSITLELRGYAIRYGYPITAPKLITFGGVDAVLTHEDVTPTTLGSPDGNRYYRLDWVLTYIIPSPPTSISVPANPYLQTDGQQ